MEKRWKKLTEEGTPLHDFPTFEVLVHQVNDILPLCEHAPQAVLSLVGFSRELSHDLGKAASSHAKIFTLKAIGFCPLAAARRCNSSRMAWGT
jgi:hypothetical protein